MPPQAIRMDPAPLDWAGSALSPEPFCPWEDILPVEAKPLFRPDALRPHLKAFQLPRPLETYRAILCKWAEMLASGKADRFKEQEILGDFLNDVFCGVLDYARPADNPERHTISREKHVQVDGKFADAVLGDFRDGNERFTVALEGKGPLDPLDRPFAGRRMSAVDQGYRYRLFSQYIDRLPIPVPSDPDRQGLATVAELCNTTGQNLYACARRLSAPASLDLWASRRWHAAGRLEPES